MMIRSMGPQIARLRKRKGLTQNDLGERLGVTFQAVSKWERGETLPDTALLLDLAEVLETTVDNLLAGERSNLSYQRKITVSEMQEALRCLDRMGQLLGRDNLLYRCAVQGIDDHMNTEIEPCFADDYLFECFTAEAILQCLKAGAYIDLTDVKNGFRHEHFREIVTRECRKYGIK